MAKMKPCKVCGNAVPKGAKICPSCGAKVKKLPVWLGVVIALVCVSIVAGALSNPSKSPSTTPADSKPSTTAAAPAESAPESKAEPKAVSETLPEKLEPDTSFDTSGYMKIDADLLFEYGSYLGGQKVITAITVKDVSASSGSVKANTDNNDSFFFSIVCNFKNKSSVGSIEEGSTVTIAGIVQEKEDLIPALSSDTTTLDDCTLIGLGEIAEELKNGVTEQREVCETAKDTYEAGIEAEAQQNKDSYIAQCETVDYSDVERNPDNYDGKNVTFSGTVIQVSEGIFDTVTLRVDDNGNTWLVSYARKEGESRILENDYITCYGECKGVTSYTTIMGSTVTVPSVDLEYYD